MTSAEAEELVRLLERNGDYRVLKRIAPDEQAIGHSASYSGTRIAAAIDVETTGLSHERDEIIELSFRRFRFDERGHVVKLDRAYSWLEQPSSPLSAEVTRITGIDDEMVAGRTIDDAQATALLQTAEVIIAHNAAFDRPFVDERLPGIAGKAWVCSCMELDWAELGLEGRGLGWLLAQIGYFYAPHRAQADVDALVTLLGHERQDGITPLSRLIEAASRPCWIVRAVGAPFETKDLLKERGYRWDPATRVWHREVVDDCLERE